MKKILTLVLATALLSVNTLFAHPNGGDEKAKQNQPANPDSSLSINEEQQLLDKIASEAEEIYYAQSSTFLPDQKKLTEGASAGKKGKEGKKLSK